MEDVEHKKVEIRKKFNEFLYFENDMDNILAFEEDLDELLHEQEKKE